MLLEMRTVYVIAIAHRLISDGFYSVGPGRDFGCKGHAMQRPTAIAGDLERRHTRAGAQVLVCDAR